MAKSRKRNIRKFRKRISVLANIIQGITTTILTNSGRPGDNIFHYNFFNTAETSLNKPYLNRFQTAVQDVNDLEVPLVAAWTVITAGLSMSGVATALLIDYNRACTEAYDSYWEVFARRS